MNKKTLGITPVKIEDFLSNEDDAILDASYDAMMKFAKEYLNYNHNKG